MCLFITHMNQQVVKSKHVVHSLNYLKTESRENCTRYMIYGQSQWPCGIKRRSAVAGLLRSWVRIPPGHGKFVCCGCCVLSGRGLCDELITRPEESYRLWCVVVCDLETSRIRRPRPALCRSATNKNIYVYIIYALPFYTAFF